LRREVFAVHQTARPTGFGIGHLNAKRHSAPVTTQFNDSIGTLRGQDM
jgi:hypothetical protein